MSRQNQGQRDEISRQRTRKGQPRCFTCGRTGHLAINGSERREASPQPLPQKSNEAVVFSKQKSRNSQTLHRRLTPRCLPPLPGKIYQTFPYVKPTVKRETRPYLGHVPEPARTQENNVQNIREEIKSYLTSTLNLFKQLPRVPKTTVYPGNQSSKAQSSRLVVLHCISPRLILSPVP